jgi:hypothetical protein
MMKRHWPLIVIISGITIIFVGFVYDVLFAGIPYQDPTPMLVARYEFHSQIASMIRWSGVSISMIGGMAAILRRLRRKGQE